MNHEPPTPSRGVERGGSPAVFTPGAGPEIPAHFGDPRAEYAALARAAGFVDRGRRGQIRVTGKERIPFLQGLVTGDLRKLAPGRGIYTIHADHNGRIVSDLWVHDRGDHLLLETEPALESGLRAAISNYIVVEDVVIAPEAIAAGAEPAITIGIDGPRAGELASAVLGDFTSPGVPLETVRTTFEGQDVLVTTREVPGSMRFLPLDMSVPVSRSVALWAALDTASRAIEGRAAGWTAAESLRLERGIPRGGADLDRELIVLEARLERAVSFDKGCYLGQETIAKMHYRGKPRQLLVSLLLDGALSMNDAPPDHDAPLFAGDDRVGRITTSGWSFGLDRWIALGYVRRDFATEGTRLAVGTPEGAAAGVHEPGTLIRPALPAT